MKKIIKLFFIIFICAVAILLIKFFNPEQNDDVLSSSYLASSETQVPLYDLEYNKVLMATRGIEVSSYSKEIVKEEETYKRIKYNNVEYLVNINNIVNDSSDAVKEKKLYVRTSSTIYKSIDTAEILSFVKKGEEVSIIGFDKLNTDGTVNKYKISYKGYEGYVYSKYLVKTKEESLAIYDENDIATYMNKMGNSLGAGSAIDLDFYPYEKPKFKDNVMPSEVRALYINSAAVRKIEEYIDFAKNNGINAFVIDIKDNTSPAYNSPVMKKYSITNYNKALNDFEDYRGYIQKAINSGIYVIGRITVFKDSYFVNDHKEVAISSGNGEPFSHNGSYWPSAFNRFVWEFNVELAREAVEELGFNEIQFDYVRFPDRTTKLENDGTINLKNNYNEEKSQAIQAFVMYACDSIHELGAYVSIDVFGESANNYVTAYGQFWSAISNVADVISGMPYPDHFSKHEYGISEVVWTVPYKVLDKWSASVVTKQNIIPTPAVVRTWIQAYNTTKIPAVIYDSDKIIEQVSALYDNGLTGGFMTWNSGSNLTKYNEISFALKKVYE